MVCEVNVIGTHFLAKVSMWLALKWYISDKLSWGFGLKWTGSWAAMENGVLENLCEIQRWVWGWWLLGELWGLGEVSYDVIKVGRWLKEVRRLRYRVGCKGCWVLEHLVAVMRFPKEVYHRFGFWFWAQHEKALECDFKKVSCWCFGQKVKGMGSVR